VMAALWRSAPDWHSKIDLRDHVGLSTVFDQKLTGLLK